MKKIKLLIPVCALLMVTIGLLAMTQKGNAPKKVTTEVSYFWYKYNPTTNTLGALLNPSSTTPIPKSAVPTDCKDDPGQPQCARAYNENNRANQSDPPLPLAVILETDPTK